MKYIILFGFILIGLVSYATAKKSHTHIGTISPDCYNKTFTKATGGPDCTNVSSNNITTYRITPISSRTQHLDKTYIYLKKIYLDDDDNVTITSNGTMLFNTFHGQNDAVVLITGELNVTVQVQTSARTDITRHFSFFYQAESCSIIGINEPTITQPMYAYNLANSVECKYHYAAKEPEKIYLSFLHFNISRGSTINVAGASVSSLTDVPSDMISTSNDVVLTINMKPNTSDGFVLKRDVVNSRCSEHIDVTKISTIASPSIPKLDNGSVITECRWILQSQKEVLGIDFNYLNLGSISDVISVIDNSQYHSLPFLQYTASSADKYKGKVVRTNGPSMIVSFHPESFASNFSASVYLAGQSKHLKGEGTFSMSPTIQDNITVFLLEVDEGKTVSLNFTQSSFSSPDSISIYEDFSTNSRKIADLQSSVWYPILSRTSKMMIKMNSFKKGTFTATFKGAVQGCMHMSPGTSDSYTLSENCNSVCSWIIPPINEKDNELQLTFQYLSLDEGDVIDIYSLDSNKTLVLTITSNVSHVSPQSFKATDGAYVKVSRGKCPKKPKDTVLIARSSYLPSCSGSVVLPSHETVVHTSPRYPDTYPLGANCICNITQSSKSNLMHIVFTELHLEPGHTLTISDVPKTGKPTIVTYTGETLPDDAFLKTDAKMVFNSQDVGKPKEPQFVHSGAGFRLNITSTDCGGITSDKKSKISGMANESLCIWKISVPWREKDGSANSLIFTVKPNDKLENCELSIYDGASVRDEKIENSTDLEIWSRNSTVIFVYRRVNDSKPSSEITIEYDTHNCDKSMQCNNGLCMHPDWRCNGKDNCGDFTDERDCQPVPIPPDVHQEGGISPVVFGFVVIIFFIMGIGVTFIPQCVRKLRNNQYRPFRDTSIIE